MRKGNINYKIIFRILGSLLFIESFFLLLSLITSLFYDEGDTMSFLYTIIVAVFIGLISRITTKNASTDIGKREGFIIVSFVWIVFSFIGSLPFIISGHIPDLTNAFFETISGFTTTGSSILNDISLIHT